MKRLLAWWAEFVSAIGPGLSEGDPVLNELRAIRREITRQRSTFTVILEQHGVAPRFMHVGPGDSITLNRQSDGRPIATLRIEEAP